MKFHFALFLSCFPLLLFSQSNERANCFNTINIDLPLEDRIPGLGPAEVGYLDADDFSFWYRLEVSESTLVKYYVAPVNEKDRYETSTYRYSGYDLCQKMLKAPPRFEEERTSSGEFELVQIKVEQDSTYYIAVLSMTPEDCGHKLILWTGNDTIRIKATHRACQENGPELLAASVDRSLGTLSQDSAGMNEMNAPDVSPTAVAATMGLSFIGSAGDSTLSRDFEVGDKATMEHIYFYPNTYAFKEAARDDLESLEEFLNLYSELSVEIQGHTASNTRIKYVDPRYQGMGAQWTFTGTSHDLSEKRAEAVRDFLIKRGIDGERVSTKGFGGSSKRYDVDMDHGLYTKNMRVEIEITKIGEVSE